MYQTKKILVPVDFTDTSRAAISAALQFAAFSGAELHLLHVERGMMEAAKSATPGEVDTILETVDVDEKALQEAFELEITRCKEGGIELPEVSVTYRVSGGNWVEVAQQMVDELHIDLIVTATHGRKGLIERFRGSDTERLVAQSTCSVFVVKPKGFPYLRD